MAVGAFVLDNIGFNVSLCTGADVGETLSILVDDTTGASVSSGFGHCIFSKHTVPDGHILSSELHVCKANEQADMTSNKLDEQ